MTPAVALPLSALRGGVADPRGAVPALRRVGGGVITALVVRRFVMIRNGDADEVLVARQRVMPAIPPHGTHVA